MTRDHSKYIPGLSYGMSGGPPPLSWSKYPPMATQFEEDISPIPGPPIPEVGLLTPIQARVIAGLEDHVLLYLIDTMSSFRLLSVDERTTLGLLWMRLDVLTK